jgi:hypothetical protein
MNDGSKQVKILIKKIIKKNLKAIKIYLLNFSLFQKKGESGIRTHGANKLI